MSLINQKLSEGKLYRKVVEHLRKCDYMLEEFFEAIDFIIRMLEDDALQRGDKLEYDKRTDNSVRPKSKPVHNNSCPFCSERHPPHGCRQVTDVAPRRRILLKRVLCFNCTKSGHRSDKCPVPSSCKICNANHHTAICDDYNAGRRPQSNPNSSNSQSTMSRPVVNATPTQHETAPRPSKVKVESKPCKSAKITQKSDVDLPCTLLPAAMAEIYQKQGSKRVRLFLDSGSQRSFISAKIASQLGLPVVGRVSLNIAPFGSTEISGQYNVVSCRVEMGKRTVRMKLVAHENVDVPIHNAGYVKVRQHLLSKGVTLADPANQSDTLKNVHILVGADYFSYFIIGVEKVDGINLFLTHNGMSPYGKVLQWLLQGEKVEQVRTLRVCKIMNEPYQFDVDEWWRLARVGIAPSEQYTVREVEAVRKMSQSVVKKPEGYQVEGYYMPHFGIRKDSRTTPLRIVFNASAKSKGSKSLNECLLPGPNLVELAYHLIMRFRLNKYAMLADISKAFHRVLLDPRDAKYTRFLWREAAGRALTFAFRVLVFGITASLYFLQQVLNNHFKGEGRPDLVKSFYVDNYMATFENLESMRQEHESVNNILTGAGMPLEGWASNHLTFHSEKE
ncbi:uncharacterized protein [Palaemon carinicauda]|uniref:uncharacterized protein n=1 Tax=Palaemon carinicauda TaxID=392227 RepID=UPI0035B5C5AA